MANGDAIYGYQPVINRGYTINMLQALQEAIASGASSVSYDGKTVTYRSMNEMLRLERIIMIGLGLFRPRSQTYLVAYDRGVPPAQNYQGDVWSGF